VYDVVKDLNPATHIPACDVNARDAVNDEFAREVGGRVGRIRKCLLPEFRVGF